MIFECPSCGCEMEQIERIKVKVSFDTEGEPLTIQGGTSRIDLVCEECGYQETGESRGVEVNVVEKEEQENE